jgi:hypothetical protein
MNKQSDDFEFEVKTRRRETENVNVRIPKDVLASLKRVAESRDMSVQALIQFYIGQCLRQDLARLFSERMLDTTAQVLSRHLESSDEVEAILREIRGETAARNV